MAASRANYSIDMLDNGSSFSYGNGQIFGWNGARNVTYAGKSIGRAKKAEPILLPFAVLSGLGPRNRVRDGRAHLGATWQIRLNDCSRRLWVDLPPNHFEQSCSFCDSYASVERRAILVIFTTRRYAKRSICRHRVCACLSICLSVCHTPLLYQNG